MNEKYATGALPPPSLTWQVGKDITAIKYVQTLDKYLDKIRSGKIIITEQDFIGLKNLLLKIEDKQKK